MLLGWKGIEDATCDQMAVEFSKRHLGITKHLITIVKGCIPTSLYPWADTCRFWDSPCPKPGYLKGWHQDKLVMLSPLTSTPHPLHKKVAWVTFWKYWGCTARGLSPVPCRHLQCRLLWCRSGWVESVLPGVCFILSCNRCLYWLEELLLTVPVSLHWLWKESVGSLSAGAAHLHWFLSE